MPKKTLTAAQQSVVVRCLARFMTPQQVQEFVKENFRLEITRQAVEAYDPTKVAGAGLKDELKALFRRERAAHLADLSAVGIANKVERLRRLERLADKAEERGSLVVSAQFVKQAKDEVELIIAGKNDPPGKGPSKANPSLKVTIERGAGDRDSSEPAREAGDGARE